MPHGIFESTNCASTHFAERIFDCVCEKDLDNGVFGYMDGLADGFSHIYNFVPGVKEGEKVVVVDQPAWNEDECRITNQRRDEFYIPAGTPFRVRVIKETDEFAVNEYAISADTRAVVTGTTDFVANDVFMTIGDDGKLVAATASTDGAAMEGRIMRKRMQGAKLVTPLRPYGSAHELYTVKVITLA